MLKRFFKINLMFKITLTPLAGYKVFEKFYREKCIKKQKKNSGYLCTLGTPVFVCKLFYIQSQH